jgi:hypothetical protein
MKTSMTDLILKRASASRSSGEWNDHDFDVLADGAIVDGIMKVTGTGGLSEGVGWSALTPPSGRP